MLVCLTLYKSFEAPITHDEAFSYEVYSSKNIKSILSFKEDVSANNHIVNTLFMKLISGIGFEQAGMLRLLSSISFLIFLISAFLMTKDEKNIASSSLYLFACCNPYLLDFFSMARGYGISFALMTLSLYLFLTFEDKNKNFWSMQIATLGMLSNFNLVYFWASFGILHLFQFVRTRNFETEILKKQIFTYLFPAISIFYLIVVFKRLTEAQQLYFGGHSGIIEDLVNDQFWCIIYDKNYSRNSLFLSIWHSVPILMILSSTLLAFFKEIRNKKSYKNWISVLFILVFSFFMIELNHRLSGSLYPIKRTGLFMSILLSISFILMMKFLTEIKYLKIPIIFISYISIGLLFYHTITSFDSKKYREVPYDSHHHEILAKLQNEVKDEKTELDFSANWQVGPALNFYKKTKFLNWLPKTGRDKIRSNAKYLLVFDEDLENLNMDSLEIQLSYPNEGLHLLKRIN